ncbi:MAG TPA: hypothetical protein ENI73_02910 [Spirochaetes bacterium]|nr:hypothetical protein [Spirochaetota bacterium]
MKKTILFLIPLILTSCFFRIGQLSSDQQQELVEAKRYITLGREYKKKTKYKKALGGVKF